MSESTRWIWSIDRSNMINTSFILALACEPEWKSIDKKGNESIHSWAIVAQLASGPVVLEHNIREAAEERLMVWAQIVSGEDEADA